MRIMPIILVGLNHRTAPIELREQLCLRGDRLHTVLQACNTATRLQSPDTDQFSTAEGAPGLVHETVILSTCNRMELYAVVEKTSRGWTTVQRFLAQQHHILPERLCAHLYCLAGQTAAKHLMRVAAGLDSMILGEPQILGQVSQALSEAQEAGTAGPVLSRLFMHAAHAGKRARSDTALSRHTTSISHVAVRLAQDKVHNLRDASALVVGAGEMGRLAAEALHMHGVRAITCINRTEASAQALAQRVQGRALAWSALPEALAWADVVITATSAPYPIIHRQDVSRALPRRQGRPLVFVDTAIPRNVEETVGALSEVSLYAIDALRAALDANHAQREAAIPAVEAILAEELGRFVAWLHHRQVVPIIADLRGKALALADDEVKQALRQLAGLPERDQQVITRLAHRIVNKLLHTPTICLKARTTHDTNCDYARVVRDLFALDAASIAASRAR
jgi:glutamyl-tRNA reductase